ncbi:hypothetical protein KSP39_PZI006754 [Platanthera zijinensis]|uniref:Uncharacterized protein n=1 Tax=Platanthera zijinensis TaxID=2320716 RepID=A0AAP0BNX0_9ASPA
MWEMRDTDDLAFLPDFSHVTFLHVRRSFMCDRFPTVLVVAPHLLFRILILSFRLTADAFLLVTAKKRVGDAKFLPASNALLLKNSAECMVGETTDHIGLNLCCGGHDAVIYGYWMGPDLEDGWGFLVASVIQR